MMSPPAPVLSTPRIFKSPQRQATAVKLEICLPSDNAELFAAIATREHEQGATDFSGLSRFQRPASSRRFPGVAFGPAGLCAKMSPWSAGAWSARVAIRAGNDIDCMSGRDEHCELRVTIVCALTARGMECSEPLSVTRWQGMPPSSFTLEAPGARLRAR